MANAQNLAGQKTAKYKQLLITTFIFTSLYKLLK